MVQPTPERRISGGEYMFEALEDSKGHLLDFRTLPDAVTLCR